MREQVFKLKKLVYEMESYLYKDNINKIIEIAKEISIISSKISADNKENLIKEEVISSTFIKSDEIEFISSVKFLIKPVTKKNFYEGDYLEKFSLQRTDELKRANVLDVHNKFWSVNEIVKGNIFGSIPIDLIDDESMNLLNIYGWEKVDVNIYKLLLNSNSQIFKFCENKFDKFLIVNVKKTNEYFVLEYKEDNNKLSSL